ncbi:hypothetical protein D3C87_1230690 [compost metagenome]
MAFNTSMSKPEIDLSAFSVSKGAYAASVPTINSFVVFVAEDPASGCSDFLVQDAVTSKDRIKVEIMNFMETPIP